MNDFTREELKILRHYLQKEMPISEGDIDLLCKIQIIIKNYDEACEHEFIDCFYGEQSIPIKLCTKCDLRVKR